jgi:hypothetical protein
MNTPPSPIILMRVHPFKWSQRDLKGMFHDLEAPCTKHFPTLIAFIASSNASVVHVPIGFAIGLRLTYFHTHIVEGVVGTLF